MSLHLTSPQQLIHAQQVVNAQAVMDAHAKSFSWAAKFLSPAARRDAAQLYAFARLADDLADEEHLGSLPQRMQQLAGLRAKVLAPQSDQTQAGDVGRLLSQHGVNPAVMAYFMDCLVQDTGPRHIQTTQELLQFAYGAAGTVGQMMCPILGAPAHSQSYAMALGIAMQLTNIARDVVEDAARGRCYVPAEWGIERQNLQAPATQAQGLQAFFAIEKILLLADDFYAYAQQGIVHIPAANRRAIDIATALYRGIGQKILRCGPAHYWQGRTSLSALEKSWLIAGCYAGKNTLQKIPPRDVVRIDLRHLAGTPGFPV